jgi:hypothetical protein
MKFSIALLSACVLTGCVVPLKKPPITAGTPEKPNIDFAQLAEFAQAAGHAYETPDLIEAAYGRKNVTVRSLPQVDVQYFIVVNNNLHTQTIAVRGSANKANTWVDVDSIKIFDLDLKIFLHEGFKHATDLLYADAQPFLRKDYQTRITGHSLGGAIAAILMLHLRKDGYLVEQVLTFGQPKVTNEQGGSTAAGAPYYRIINDQDIVAQVPPSNIIYDLSGTYQHFGPEIVLHADHTWTYSTVNIPRDLITGDNWRKVNLQDATDHQIKNYIDRISALK